MDAERRPRRSCIPKRGRGTFSAILLHCRQLSRTITLSTSPIDLQPADPGRSHAGRQVRDAGVHQPAGPFRGLGWPRSRFPPRPRKQQFLLRGRLRNSHISRVLESQDAPGALPVWAADARPPRLPRPASNIAIDSKGNLYGRNVNPATARAEVFAARECRKRLRSNALTAVHWRRRRYGESR